MERTTKKLTVAHYVRVSVKEPDDHSAMPSVGMSKLSEEEIGTPNTKEWKPVRKRGEGETLRNSVGSPLKAEEAA